MPFWKQSDDPWDRKPEKRRVEPQQPKENPIDSLKAWNEKRKAERTERIPAPIPCPWCGKPMETGYIMGSHGIWWGPGIPGFQAKWISAELAEESFRVDTEGGLSCHRTAWLCRECGKMVFDIPESERVYDFPETQDDEPSEITQEEETSEE